MSINVVGDLFSNFVKEDNNSEVVEEEQQTITTITNTDSIHDASNGTNHTKQMDVGEEEDENNSEENYMHKLKEYVKEYEQLDQQEPSSDDELIKFTKDKEERLLFRLGRLLEKKKKQRKRKHQEVYEE